MITSVAPPKQIAAAVKRLCEAHNKTDCVVIMSSLPSAHWPDRLLRCLCDFGCPHDSPLAKAINQKDEQRDENR